MPTEDFMDRELTLEDVMKRVTGSGGGEEDGEGSDNEDWSVSDESGEEAGATENSKIQKPYIESLLKAFNNELPETPPVRIVEQINPPG